MILSTRHSYHARHLEGRITTGSNSYSKDNLREIYDKIFDIDAKPLPTPEDYYTPLANAIEAAGEGHTTTMDQHELLYLFEYHKISKVGGVSSPYACV